MILCTLSDSSRYDALSPAIATALEWLRTHADDYPEPGTKVEIAPGILVKSQSVGLIPRDKAALEVHRRYIDIQVPLKTTETIGWADTADLKIVRNEYDETRDVAFYGDQAQCLVHVRPGQLVILFPEDAHAPNIGLGNHRKLVIKVPV